MLLLNDIRHRINMLKIHKKLILETGVGALGDSL